ncbi:unnamed protein product [Paramecium sonneborni]|nr:unnamed protein product [Paramecium sonneborni]
MNKSFNALGTFIQDINKQISPLQILFQFKCIQGKKIKAQFNKCSTCVGLSKSYNQNQVCYNNKQIISFYPKYNTDAFYKGNLRILIENSKITITQLLYDRQVVIAMIEYLDQ